MDILQNIIHKLDIRKQCGTFRQTKLPINTQYDYSSNDYLLLSGSIKARLWHLYAVIFYGKSKCASKYINGYTQLHQKLENVVAKAYNAEKALIFSSGYLASIGVLQGICEKNTIILADRHIHASWIDGAFVVGSRIIRFNHNDITHLDELLLKYQDFQIVILTEIVFSMQGVVIDVDQYVHLAKKYGAVLITDNAHGLGVLPCYKISYLLHIQVGTFSKSCAGFGGYVCGNENIISAIANFGRTQIYSTVLPDYILFFNFCAFKYVCKNYGRMIERVENLANKYEMKFCGSAILTKEFETVGEAEEFQSTLLSEGIYVPVVRPPTVPKTIIRMCVCC
ncbi:MAG: 8-amino-7-oxononanoate synthase [Candidatus Deianiraeaceae bacterium]|jgi:8-amino-7-oxononanoate synthase